MSNGFIKVKRNERINDLTKHPYESNLLLVIALRAKRTNAPGNKDLELGEALLGDHTNYGLTAREYRTCKSKLEKWEFATFKTTNKGTIAKLVDDSIYDINLDGERQSKRQANDKQTTTNKK